MLKIREGYRLRDILNVYLVVSTGASTFRPNCIMTLNASGAFLWKILLNGASEEDLIDRLQAEFELEHDQAVTDTMAFLDEMKENGLIETC